VKLSSPQAFRIAKYLLENPITYQHQIHRDLGTSIGWINKVVNSLCEAGIARKGKWRRIELEEEITAAEKNLRDICLKSQLNYALTAFSGLSRYLAYYITFPTIHTYTTNPKQLKQQLPKGRGPITIKILKPDYPDILKNTKTIKNFHVADPTQVVIDLFCLGAAGRDAATKLYEMTRNEQ